MNKKKAAPRNSNQPLRERSQVGNRPVNKGSSADDGGIYDNKRFTLACTALVGAPVTIETVDGNVYEGIFRVFSPQLELMLDVAHLVDAKDPGKICEENVRSMVFNMKDVIRCSAIDTDLDYATKDGFLTDAQISGTKVNGEAPMKQLEQWQPDGIEESELHDLNSGDANGWTPEDMFAMNEREHGVKTTYKSNLEGYTIQLNTDRSSEEFREREALATELAREIEGNQTSRVDVELEDGNEEEAFSAVTRPQRGGSDRNSAEQDHESKYIPPARRQNSNSNQSHGSIGRDNRNAGPRHQQQPSPHGHDGRQAVQQPPHHQQRRDYNNAPASVSPHQMSSHSGRDHHVHHHDDYGRSGGGGGGGPTNRRTSYGRSEHDGGHQHQPHHQQQKPMQGGRGGQTGAGPNRNRGDQISELKDFGNKFNLSTSPVVSVQQDQTSPKLGHHQQAQQFHAPQTQQLPIRSPVLSERKGASPTLAIAEQRHSVSPPQHQQQQLQPQQPAQSNVASPNAIQRQKSETESAQATILTQQVAPPEASTATLVSASTPLVAAQTSSAPNVKKSTLNPNAKEFVFNPNAKPFVPVGTSNTGQVVTISQGRPPISATPPRPMTPATPTIPIAYTANPMPPHLMAQVGPAGVQPQHQYYQIVPTSMAGPMYSAGPQVSPYGAFQSNQAIPISQQTLQQAPQQQQQQMHQQQQRYRPNANPGPRPVNPVEVQSPNHVLASTGQPILTQMPTASPSQQHNYVQFPPQAAHNQFAAANMAAMMQQQANLMRFPPGSMAHMMVTQAPNTMPITTMSGILDPSGQHIAWMQSQQGPAPPPHMPGVPPPNPMGGPHLGQPPPQPGQQQPQHTPQSVASPAQVAAVQAAVAQQQQMSNNGGGHTPAPSPGPMGIYNTSGPQSLPPTFQAPYPGNVFMMPHGGAGPHAVLQQQIISTQGQPIPPPQMHQFALQHPGISGQQNAHHSMLYPMAAQHAANMAAAAQVQGPPQGPAPPQ